MLNYKDLNHENYKLILNSCLFDEKWYIKHYFNNSVDENFNAIIHFLIKGVFENYNPNPLFNTEFYLLMNRDVANVNANPLIHYILWGKDEKRLFSSTFEIKNHSLEEELYYANIDSELKNSINYIIKHELFDYDYYLKNNEDVKKANVNPLIHYLMIGAKEYRNPSKNFNTKNYFKKYPNLEKNNINPLIHYVINKNIPDETNSLHDEHIDYKSLSDEKKIQYLYKKILKLEKELNYKTEENEKILNSFNQYFDYLYVNQHISNPGLIRNTQLQTLEMLKFIDKICEKYNLKYWLDYGTLIGAMRHSGFIPWDDDIDIGMPREDYEQLLKILPLELEKNSLLNGRIRFQILSQHIRNEVENMEELFPTPCIQFVDNIPLANIDFFVLDYYEITPNNTIPLFKNHDFSRQILSEFDINIQNKNSSEINEEYKKSSAKLGIKFEKTEYLGCSLDTVGLKVPTHINNIYPLKKAEFEGYMFNIPQNPLKYLSDAYYKGDVMKLPKKIHNHDRMIDINNQLNGEDIEKELKKAITLWKYINNSHPF